MWYVSPACPTPDYSILLSYPSSLRFVRDTSASTIFPQRADFLPHSLEPMLYTWSSQNTAGHTKKLCTTGVVFVAQCAGNVSGSLWLIFVGPDFVDCWAIALYYR